AAAEDQQHQDRDRQVGAHSDQDLGLGAHALPTSGPSLKRWAMPWAAKETVKRTATRIAEERPASRSTIPAASTAAAISPTRPSVETPTVAIARWRLPAASSALARRSASAWMPRCTSQTPAPAANPSMGSPPSRKTARAAARTTRSTYL